jgi:hypothetical protein
MKVLFLNTPFTFPFIARQTPISNTIDVVLRNEVSQVVISQSVTWELIKGKVYVTLTSDADFVTKNKYELEIQDNEITIYRGKLMILEENTDLQNYDNETQSDKEYNYV